MALRGRGVPARLALLVLAVTLVVTAVPASAAVGATNATGRVELEGRGWGHGRGMSQWGARGAAERGLTWQQIAGFYYPGTTLSTGYAGSSIRVELGALRRAPLRVLPVSGLMVDTGRCSQVLPASSGVTSWRVLRTSSGTWALQYYSATTSQWRSWSSSCAVSSATTVTFRNTNHASTSEISVVQPGGSTRAYRGWARAIPSGTTSQWAVNVVMLEHYLYSVVPSEMPSSWHYQALRAQSVAARSYAAQRLGAPGQFDICDTQLCQVYSGRSTEVPSVVAAVDATAGRVLTYGGEVAVTEFSAYNGGQVAPGPLPYQQAKPDPYDGAYPVPATTWRVALPTTTIEKAFPAAGTFRELVVERDGHGRWGGRATYVDVVGSEGTVTVTGSRFRTALGLKSTYVSPVGSGVGTDFPANAFSDVLGRDGSGTLWLYPGNGRGSWLSKRLVASGLGTLAVALAPGDMDGDGYEDVLATTTSGALLLYAGTGNGGVRAPRTVGSGWRTYTELTGPGDFDGDGRGDLLARDSSGVLWVYRGNGAGGWLGRTLVSSGWGSLSEVEAVGDFDRDGTKDLVAVDSAGKLRLYSFSAKGVWVAVREIGWGWGALSALTGPGDFDGDGLADLLARDSRGGLLLYRGDGAGGWLGKATVGSGWGGFADITS